MFYYRDRIPAKGTIVVAQLINIEENESCLYVTLPEYNNSRGTIQKAELPKKVKKQKETLKNLKHQHGGMIICTISETASIDLNKNLHGIVELSIRGVDKKFEPQILIRQRNMERIIKLVKFISMEFKLPYESLIFELQNNIVLPLTMDDITTTDDDDTSDKNINDYNDVYSNFLRNPQHLLIEVGIDPNSDIHKNIITTLKTMIKETNVTSSLDFNIKIWKSNNDANIIQTLRDMFEFVKSQHDNIEFRYIGAPTYQININVINSNLIDQFYQSINQSIINWLIDKNVMGYDLQFDIAQKKVKYGDVTIHYPKMEGLI